MLNFSKKELDKNLNLKEGFIISQISSEDLEIIRDLVNLHWKKVLLSNYPKKFNDTETLHVYDYHKISDLIDHKKLWPMKNRILSISKSLVSQIYDYQEERKKYDIYEQIYLVLLCHSIYHL